MIQLFSYLFVFVCFLLVVYVQWPQGCYAVSCSLWYHFLFACFVNIHANKERNCNFCHSKYLLYVIMNIVTGEIGGLSMSIVIHVIVLICSLQAKQPQ